MKKLRQILWIVPLVIMLMANVGWGQNPSNGGFENSLTGWTTTGSQNSEYAITGTYSLLSALTCQIPMIIHANSETITIPNNYYGIVIAWAKGINWCSVAGIGGSLNGVQNSTTAAHIDVNLTRLTYSSAENSTGIDATFSCHVYSRSAQLNFYTQVYFDDVIMYSSLTATPDVTKPVAPTSFTNVTITSSSIGFSWTNGSDAETGIQNTIILRTTNLSASTPIMNDQGVYTTAGGTGGPNIVSTDWTVISVSVGSGATTYTDNSVSASTSYKYAVIHRDLAYNYSNALVSSTITTLASEPTGQVTAITFGNFVVANFDISWSAGNGTRRAVFVREGDAGSITNPSDGTGYTASSNWSSKGTQLGSSGYYCVYDGTGTTVPLTGLSANTAYYIQAFEYNGSGSSANYYTATATGNPSDVLNISSGTSLSAGTYTNMNVNAALTLTGNVSISGTLTMTSGLLTLGANTLTLENAITVTSPDNTKMIVLDDGTNQGTLKLKMATNSTNYLFPVGDSRSGNRYSPITLNFVSGLNSSSYVSAKVFGIAEPNNTSTSPILNRYWDLTPTGLDLTYSYNIVMQYLDGDVTGTEADLVFGKYSAGWVELIGTLNTIANTFTTTTPINTFSSYSGGQQSAMPVELSSFTSNIITRDVKLNWVTASENNNAGFEILRSAQNDNGSWTKIGYVTGNGTKTTPTNYSFEDKNLNTGKYNYRLKQIDYNGNFEYFNLAGEVEIGVPKKFDISQNYPNPFNPTAKIDFDLPFDSKVSMKLYDISGREVMTLVNEQKSAGYYTVQMNGNNLSSGMYFYRIIAEGNGQKYVMTKKAVLIK
jgi:hypothetical protein